jgi:WD40 repeat protein
MMQEVPSVPGHTLIRPIGKGAFGIVWLAQNEVTQRYRAIKVVQRDSLENSHHFDREFNGIQRFEPLSRNHDGLVDILEVGRSPGGSYFYYIMELGDDLEPRQDFSPEKYEPRTLAAECEVRGRITAPDAALIGAQLAQALGFLHDGGLSHCDVKPSNILFVRGVPKIGDPGLVSMIDASQSMRGTPGYLAPEGPGTSRADIYSLGKLLYTISTGRPPGQYPGLPPGITDAAHGNAFRRLNSVVVKACAHNPEERYPTAAALRADLLEVHAGHSPVEARRRLRRAVQAGALLAVLVVVITFFYERARRQAEERKSLLAQNYSESGIRLDDENKSLAGLAFFAEALQTDPNPTRADATARRISFTWRYSPRLVAQWRSAHTINRLAYSPTGDRLALASAHGEVWLWDGTAKPPERVGQHGGEVTAIEFTRDGNWLVSGGSDEVVRFWNLTNASGHHVTQVGKAVASLALHPTELRLAVGLSDGSARFLSLAGDVQPGIQVTDKSGKALRSIAFSPDGSRCLAGNEDGKVYELSLATNKMWLAEPSSWVYDIAFRADGAWVAAVGNRARLFRDAAAALPARLRHPTLVRSVAFSPANPDRLLTACFDQNVRLWSCDDDLELIAPIPTEAGPQHAIFDPKGETFAVCTFSGLVRIYAFVQPFSGGPGIMAASADGSRYVHVGQSKNKAEQRITLRETTSNRQVASIEVESNVVSELQVNRDGTKVLLVQTKDKSTQFRLWDIPQEKVLGSFTLSGPARSELALSGEVVALITPEKLLLWRPPAEPVLVRSWTLGSEWDPEVAFSSRNDRVTAVWSTNILVVTHVGQVVKEWSFPVGVPTVDLDPTGARVLVGEDPPAFEPSVGRVWNVDTARPDSPPMELDDGCFIARFDPTGMGLLLGDQAKNSILCSRMTGQWRRHPRTMHHPGIVVSANFSPDGRWLATQSGDRSGDTPGVRVWDTGSAEPVTPVLNTGKKGRVFMVGDEAVLFSRRGGSSPYWRRWNLRILPGPMQDLVDLAHLLSCRRVSSSGETSQLKASELNELWNRLSVAHPEWFSRAAEAE